jgi:hypothetical protein
MICGKCGHKIYEEIIDNISERFKEHRIKKPLNFCHCGCTNHTSTFKKELLQREMKK